jgi:hypothetical protein
MEIDELVNTSSLNLESSTLYPSLRSNYLS